MNLVESPRMPQTKIKIAHVSTADNIGGSGRSAYKIHSGLIGLGHDSRMFVSMRITKDTSVGYVAGTKILQRLDKWLGRLIDLTGLQNFGYFASLTLPFRHSCRTADIVQFYNLHHYYTNQFMPLLFGKKPIVWRLSDQWPMTGHCAYSYSCERWKTGCGSCPALAEYDALTWDTSAFLWRMKRNTYSKLNLTVVAPSKWMAEMAKASPILGEVPIHYIPNGIDVKTYYPSDKAQIRTNLAIPHDSIVILFSAHGLTSERKGGKYVNRALSKLRPELKSKCFLLLVGEGKDEDFMHLGIGYKIVQEYKDEKRLASFFQAADIGIFPSRAENLPNTVLEAMACGVPCISFNVGGIPDAVIHEETGLHANPDDPEDLMRNLALLIENSELREELSKNCVRVIHEKFTTIKQTKAFEALYHSILAKETKQCVE